MLRLLGVMVAIALTGCVAGGAKQETQASSPTSMLGIKGLDTPPPFAAAAKLDPPRGAFVLIVDRGSLAEEAGIRTGDIILTYDGAPVMSMGALLGALARTSMGSTIKLIFWHGGGEDAVDIRFSPSMCPAYVARGGGCSIRSRTLDAATVSSS